MEIFCKHHNLTLKISDNPMHEFRFADGDWIYYGTSETLDVTFDCSDHPLITEDNLTL
jgi:hypothetical protein